MYISPKIEGYERDFCETKYMSFLIKHDKLLEKYNEIWERFKNSIKKEFDSKLVHTEKYLNIKIKSYNGKSTQIFKIINTKGGFSNLFVYQ